MHGLEISKLIQIGVLYKKLQGFGDSLLEIHAYFNYYCVKKPLRCSISLSITYKVLQLPVYLHNYVFKSFAAIVMKMKGDILKPGNWLFGLLHFTASKLCSVKKPGRCLYLM